MEAAANRLWRNLYPEHGSDGLESWAIPMDVVHEGDNVVVRASLPGVSPEDIDVTIEEGVLTIKAHTKEEHESHEGGYLMRERRSGSFYRALRLPESVDSEKAEPHYENGVLTISFPKLEEKKARRLPITVGGQKKALGSEKKAA
jgi:HSP20 family protein